MEQNLFDVIVIGGGPGGYTAALYAARSGLSTLVLEKLSPGGQMGTTDQIDNYPGFPRGINGFELAMEMKEGAERFGAKTELSGVISVELNGKIKQVRTKKGTYQSRTVILACGAEPRELGLPGEKELRGRGVSYCATCDGMFYRGKTTAVIGGGNTAVADALYLSRLCEKVYIVHRRDELRASRVYEKALAEGKNIEIIWNSNATKLIYGDTLTGVAVRDKITGAEREISCSGVFVAIGHEPNTGLIKGMIDLTDRGYVKADETTRTNIPGVFAVGDMREKPLRQVVTAAADGAVAAHFAEEYLSEK